MIHCFGGLCGREVLLKISQNPLQNKPCNLFSPTTRGFVFASTLIFFNDFLVSFFLFDCNVEQIFTLKQQHKANAFSELFC